MVTDQPARSMERVLPPAPRISTPKVDRITMKCVTSAIRMLATMAIGMKGGLAVMIHRAQSGAWPPGEGRRRTANPPQTKLMPSVTTMDGRLRRWISAPSAA